MLKNWKIVRIIATLVLTGATLIIAGPWSSGGPNDSVASGETAEPSPQKTTGPPAAPPPTREQRLITATEYSKKLLLLMDTDKNGKVSKKEWMDFMSKEFDLLDTDHDGELDVKELTGVRVPPFAGK